MIRLTTKVLNFLLKVMHRIKQSSSPVLLLLILTSMIPVYSHACTIFLLTDEDQTLFFSNEDYTNPNTFMWFIPMGEGHYGCAYVGFDNGQAQGGMNSEGLAFDWWAGAYNPYDWEKSKPRAKGSSSMRMLESCKNVEEAIEFYKIHAEPSFANATIFIADKTGSSVIIGSKDGKLFFDRSTQSRVLGAGTKTFGTLHEKNPSVDMENGTQILRQCVTTGTFATKYSHIFDLRTGDITLHRFEKEEAPAHLNLHPELQKGEHFYNIPSLKQQLKEEPRALLINMRRMVLFVYEKIQDNVHANKLPLELLIDLSNGTIDASQYADGFWENLEEEQAEIKASLLSFGTLKYIDPIQKEDQKDDTVYHFVAIYKHGRILWKFRFDKDRIVQNLQVRAAALTG
ncbi:MAG: hypothetical protein AAF696_16320 [Bacteroidota bacterium]